MDADARRDLRNDPFRVGDTIALRSLHEFPERGPAVSFAVAGRVLVDDEDVAVVASPVGAEVRRRAGIGSGPNSRLILAEDWDGSYLEDRWVGAPVVRVHPKGLPWSVWRWYDVNEWAPHWYVNLELPWVRTPLGFDTQDWTLDVIASVAPDGAWSVQYKDQDELDFLVSRGHWPETMRAVIEQTGADATDAALRRDFPFDVDWSPWIPDAAWPALRLPKSWEQPG